MILRWFSQIHMHSAVVKLGQMFFMYVEIIHLEPFFYFFFFNSLGRIVKKIDLSAIVKLYFWTIRKKVYTTALWHGYRFSFHWKKGWRFDISDMEFWRQLAAHSGDFLFIFYCICKKCSQIMQIKAKNIPRHLIGYH